MFDFKSRAWAFHLVDLQLEVGDSHVWICGFVQLQCPAAEIVRMFCVDFVNGWFVVV